MTVNHSVHAHAPYARAGSLFALEVLHRAGVEFFEVIPFSVCAGLVCLLVFRALTGEPYGGIWDFEAPITAVDWRHILLGAGGLGLRVRVELASGLAAVPGSTTSCSVRGAEGSRSG